MSTSLAAPKLPAEVFHGNAAKAPLQRHAYFFSVAVVALFLRVGTAFIMMRGRSGAWFFGQASELGCLAQSIVSGHGLASPFGGFTGPSAFLAPGYPLLVALAFRLCGAYSTQAATLLIGLQILFGVGTVVTLMFVARKLFGCRIANIAGIICAIHPLLICLPAMFWETSLSMLSMIAALALAVFCVDRRSKKHWFWMGVVCAVATLVNPALSLTFGGILAWTAWVSRGKSQHLPLLTAAVWLLLFAAWPIRNAITMERFIPLRSNLGYELWQGNRPGSDGTFDSSLHPNTNHDEFAAYAQNGELAYMHGKYELAMSTIKADPLRFLKLSLTRALRFWLGLNGKENSMIVAISVTSSSLLAIAGLGLLLRYRRGIGPLFILPLLLYPIPYYITHADFRFRLVLEPMALLLAACLLSFLSVDYKTSCDSRAPVS